MTTISKSWDEIQPCPRCGAWYVRLGRSMVLDAGEMTKLAREARSADDIRLLRSAARAWEILLGMLREALWERERLLYFEYQKDPASYPGKYSRKFFRVIDYLDDVYDGTVSRLTTEEEVKK